MTRLQPLKKRAAKPTVVLVRVALGTALIMLTTLISIPVMMGGYVHLGDALIFLGCIFLGWWAVPAAAIGSALADLILGYVYWIPGTLIIKGLMAVITLLIIGKTPINKKHAIFRIIIAFSVSSLFMQAGYLGYQIIIAFMGFGENILAAGAYLVAVNFLLGCIQSVIAVPIATLVCKRLEKYEYLYIDTYRVSLGRKQNGIYGSR